MRSIAIAATLATALAGGCSSSAVDPVQTASVEVDHMAEVVKVYVGGGHGSGFHIGNGLVVTAAHVVDKGAIEKLTFENGGEESATVLWSNKEYDIALLRMGDMADRFAVPAANLECRVPKVGEPILARGNPGSIEFIEVRGFVAGKMRKVGDAWLEGVITDISFTGGISGGPVYDAGGNVVGVAVGVMAAPTGSGRDGYGTGVAVIVPASTVCMLLGREVEVG